MSLIEAPKKRYRFKSKMTRLIGLVCGIATLILTIGFVTHLWVDGHRKAVELLQAHADVVGINSIASLVFDDADAARESLASLEVIEEIEEAALYHADRQMLAQYLNEQAHGHSEPNKPLADFGYEFDGCVLKLVAPIESDGEVVGAIYLRYSMMEVEAEMYRIGLAGLGFGGVAFLIAYVLAWRFQSTLTRPIGEMSEVANKVFESQDYSQRAVKFANDELGDLTDCFNQMLSRIAEHEAELALANSKLEVRVHERTRQLEASTQDAVTAAEALEQKNATVNLLQRISCAANEAVSFDDAIQNALEELCWHIGWPIGHCYRVNEDDGTTLCSTGIWSLLDQDFMDFRQASEQEEFESGEGLPGRVLASGKSSWVGDVQLDNNYSRRESCIQAGIRGAFACPILIDQEVVAVLEFYSLDRIEPNDDLLSVIEPVGAQLGRVAERQRSERIRDELSKSMIEASREAGKSEVATGVLHNVGNLLNSVNTSVGEMSRSMKLLKVVDLAAASKLVNEHSENLGDFVTNDPQGSLLPRFLEQLSNGMANSEKTISHELDQLTNNVDHIKNIVSMQQSYASTVQVLEKLPVDGLVKDALAMYQAALVRHNIEIETHYNNELMVKTDRHMVLQILINLISNAKNVLSESSEGKRKLNISIKQVPIEEAEGEDMVRIEVVDNGPGISKENLCQIFQHGFTTRRRGHGFGLHAAANAAMVLGGKLAAHSKGIGCGASFTLDLPIDHVQEGVTV